jgi:heterodisulfide reductase subunit B
MDYRSICTQFCTDPDMVGMGCCEGGIAINFKKDGKDWIFLNYKCAKELYEMLKSTVECSSFENREKNFKKQDRQYHEEMNHKLCKVCNDYDCKHTQS